MAPVLAAVLLLGGAAPTEGDQPRTYAPLAEASLGPIEQVIPVPVPTPGVTTLRGTVSTYGRGYDGLLALPEPYGRGWRVRVCGPLGCVTGVSNDVGPVPSLHRIADLDLPRFERVCGPLAVGLCTATVSLLGRSE